MLSSDSGEPRRSFHGATIFRECLPLVVDLDRAIIQVDISNTSSEVNETSLIFYENGVAGTDSNHTSRGLVYADFYLTTLWVDVEHTFNF